MTLWNSSGQTPVVFRDRADAGRRLAKLLGQYANRDDVIVLAIPRGGVVVAYEAAQFLGVELDIFISRKLGAPGQEELAFGAISTGGVRVLDEAIIDALGISKSKIERITGQAQTELDRRERVYRGSRAKLKLEGRTVILIDDGIATGSSMLAAVDALRQLKPARIVVAAPVAPMKACEELKSKVDEVVCVHAPESFYAIGQFYEDFSQIEDEEVTDLLRRAQERAGREDNSSHQEIKTGVR